MTDKKQLEEDKSEFSRLRDEARQNFLGAVDCLAKAYLTPYIQKQLKNKKKLDQKDIIKKVDIASRMMYPEVLKSYFGYKEDGDGKSGRTIEVKPDEEASRAGK